MKKGILLLIILISICSIYYFNKSTTKINLYQELGYNDNEIVIINTLNYPKIILDYDYNSNIIEIINNKDFKEENIKTYIEMLNTYDIDLDNIIYIVNSNFYDSSVFYSSETVSLMKTDYYINDNLARYLDYKNKYPTKDIIDIVANINCNLDFNFYTNISGADLSKNYLILVNKFYQLASDYIPPNLVSIDPIYGVEYQLESKVYEQYTKMWADAKKQGLTLYINSPYRSYNTQAKLYQNYASRDGYTLADRYSARAGFSEHQTGLAFDVTSLVSTFDDFEDSKEYSWLSDNAYKYGFILRYPRGKEYITGYMYESWHYRYVGEEVALKMKDLGITFEEYYAFYVK